MLNYGVSKAWKLRSGYFILIALLLAPGAPAARIPVTPQSNTTSTPDANGTRPKIDVPATTGPPLDLGRTDLGISTPSNSSILNLMVAIGTPDSPNSHESLKLGGEGDKKRAPPGSMIQARYTLVCPPPPHVLGMNPDPAAYPRFLKKQMEDLFNSERVIELASRPNFQQLLADGMTRGARAMIHLEMPLPGGSGTHGGWVARPAIKFHNYVRADCKCTLAGVESQPPPAVAQGPRNGPEALQNLVDPVGAPAPIAGERPEAFQHLLDAVNLANLEGAPAFRHLLDAVDLFAAAEILYNGANSKGPELYGPGELDYKYGGPSGGRFDGPGGFFGGGYNPYGDGGAGSGSALGLKKKSEIQPPPAETEEGRSQAENGG
ncbi:hypothetical protein TWF481_006089 [Arthrobotrys musiformis]|uniref:Uncharacterized protein n=1 Tax=Arthrobotrys musiformis TaxID=47236 RepID=A0AAV9WGV8_9PEZI